MPIFINVCLPRRTVSAVNSWFRNTRVAAHPTLKTRFTLLDATHELTPEGKIKKVHFRKLRFNARKFLHDVFGTSVEPH